MCRHPLVEAGVTDAGTCCAEHNATRASATLLHGNINTWRPGHRQEHHLSKTFEEGVLLCSRMVLPVPVVRNFQALDSK